MRTIHLLALFILFFFSNQLQAQCADSQFCNGNTGLYSNDDAGTIGYDNMGSGYHGTYIKAPNGEWKVWGQGLKYNNSNATSPVLVDATNYPGLTGNVYMIGIGGSTQMIVLTSTGLFAVGGQGNVISYTLTTSGTFQKITVDNKADGLPANVTPEDVRMLFVSNSVLMITTCSGEVYVLSEFDDYQGHGAQGSSTSWYRVMQDAATPLSNVIVARGSSAFAFALKADGTLWTWGVSTLLGEGSNFMSRNYATQMTLPAGMPGVKMIQGTSGPSYYVLGTDKKVYSLGYNSDKQLGDRTNTSRFVWVNARNPDNSIITDAAWISANEHDGNYPTMAIIREGGKLYNCGNNSYEMIGRPASVSDDYLAMPLGISASDVITQVESGGHSTAVIKLGSPRYGYVGHRIGGSMGDGSAQDATQPTFDFITPPIVSVCGTVCTVQPVLVANSTTICAGTNAVFTINGRAGDAVSYTINSGAIQTVTIGINGSVNITIPAPTVTQTISLKSVLGATSDCSNLLTAQSSISISNNLSPTFTPVAPICSGANLSPLPTTSNNGIVGIWSPPLNNTQTTTYTFTPSSCAQSVPMTIVVNSRVQPTFDSIDAICYGEPGFSLPTVSSNGISGMWSPVFNNTQTAAYVFTPDPDECSLQGSMTVNILDDFDFTFRKYCKNDKLFVEVEPLLQTFDADLSTYSWQFNSIQVSNDPAFDVTSYLKSTDINEPLPITFTVTVTNANGCPKSKPFAIENVYCGIQKGVSPNNDGLNEFFDLRLLHVKQLTIFNRYGSKVYSKKNYFDQWHGQSDNGDILPDATYYYVIDFENEASKTGWIYINNEH